MSLDRLVYFGQVVRGGKLGVVDAPPPPPPPPPRQGPPPPPPMEEGDLRDIIARLEEFLNGPLRLNQAPLTQEQVAVILRDLLHPEAGMFRPDLPLIGRWTVQLFRTTDIVIGALNWAPGADAQNIQVGRDVVTAILNAANARLGLQGGLRGGRAPPWADLDELLALKERFMEEMADLANDEPLSQDDVILRVRNALLPQPGESLKTIQILRKNVKSGILWAPGENMMNNRMGEQYLFQLVQKIEAWIQANHPAPPQVFGPPLPQELHGLFGNGLRGGMDNQENLNGEDYAEEVLPPVFPDNNITDAVDAIHSEILAALGAGPLNADDIEERFEAFLMRQTPGVQAVIGYFRNTHEYQPDYTQDRNMTNGRNYWNWLDGLQDRMEDGD